MIAVEPLHILMCKMFALNPDTYSQDLTMIQSNLKDRYGFEYGLNEIEEAVLKVEGNYVEDIAEEEDFI